MHGQELDPFERRGDSTPRAGFIPMDCCCFSLAQGVDTWGWKASVMFPFLLSCPLWGQESKKGKKSIFSAFPGVNALG
jgi:hypothetical protein